MKRKEKWFEEGDWGRGPLAACDRPLRSRQCAAVQQSMLMLTTAFGGYDYVMSAYEVALKEGYRFGLYGDAMLIID